MSDGLRVGINPVVLAEVGAGGTALVTTVLATGLRQREARAASKAYADGYVSSEQIRLGAHLIEFYDVQSSARFFGQNSGVPILEMHQFVFPVLEVEKRLRSLPEEKRMAIVGRLVALRQTDPRLNEKAVCLLHSAVLKGQWSWIDVDSIGFKEVMSVAARDKELFSLITGAGWGRMVMVSSSWGQPGTVPEMIAVLKVRQEDRNWEIRLAGIAEERHSKRARLSTRVALPGAALTGILAADLGARYFCSGQNFYQAFFTGATCR